MNRRPASSASRATVSLRRSGVWLAAALGVAGLVATSLPADPAAAVQRVVVRVSTSGTDAGDGSAAHPYRTIARAVTQSPEGATIVVAGGEYQPFVMTKARQTVVAAPRNRQPVVVRGTASAQDVIRISAPGATLAGITVTGCVPSAVPSGQLEDAGSSDVRINDGTTDVTVRNVTITDSEGTNSEDQPVGCYGIFAHNANRFRIVADDISGTGTGVFVNGGGQNAVIARNDIHDNTVLIRDTAAENDDYGASGIFLAHVNAVPGVLSTHNTLTNNQGTSLDYQTDGGGFEIFDASNTQIIANTISNNDIALETGTNHPGVCAANVFSGNIVTGRSGPVQVNRSPGLLLRCATDMVISNNTFTDLDWWVYDIEVSDQFSTDVNGLAITGNTVNQSQNTTTLSTPVQQGAPVYYLGVSPTAANLIINANRFHVTSSRFATYVPSYDENYSDSATLAQWQARTSQDTASVNR